MAPEPGEYRIFVRSDGKGVALPAADDLRVHFSQFGEVTDVHKPARTLDMAYVTMESEGDLGAALLDSNPMIAGVGTNLQQAEKRGPAPVSAPMGGGWMPMGNGVVPMPSMPPMVHIGGGASPARVASPAASATEGSTRVYISGIADELDNETLQAYFNYFGTVKDVYIPMNQQTGRRKQFAFVTMATTDEAEAVAALPTHQVTEQHSVAAVMAAPKGSFAMGGVPAAARPPLQAVVQVPAAGMGGVVMGQGGMRMMAAQPGVGGVVMGHGGMRLVAAQPGMGGMGGIACMGGMCGAGMQQQIMQVVPQALVTDTTRLYVTRLTEEISDEMLQVYFSYFGVVKDVFIPVDKATGEKKPFAFVTMASPRDVQSVLAFPSHQITESVSVNVDPAAARPPLGAEPCALAVPMQQAQGAFNFAPGPVPRGSVGQDFNMQAGVAMGAEGQVVKQGIPGTNRLFVTGMPLGLSDGMLRGHFSHYGDILDVFVPPRTPENAYITFSTAEELQNALANSGVRIAGFTVQGIKEAAPKEGKGKGRAGPY